MNSRNFVCGISIVAMARARLDCKPLFGYFAVPRQSARVLERISSLSFVSSHKNYGLRLVCLQNTSSFRPATGIEAEREFNQIANANNAKQRTMWFGLRPAAESPPQKFIT